MMSCCSVPSIYIVIEIVFCLFEQFQIKIQCRSSLCKHNCAQNCNGQQLFNWISFSLYGYYLRLFIMIMSTNQPVNDDFIL